MFIHFGIFLGYYFPFANIIVPLIIWQSNKESDFLDKHGKAVMNFQLSLFLYHLVALLIFLAFFLTNILDMIGLRSEDTSYATFGEPALDRKSTRLNSSHVTNSYAVFCFK